MAMTNDTQTLSDVRTIDELLNRPGDIPANRVRFHPTPGSAIEQDLLALDAEGDRRCELVDGTRVVV